MNVVHVLVVHLVCYDLVLNLGGESFVHGGLPLLVEAAEPADTHVSEVTVIKGNGVNGGRVGGYAAVRQTMRANVVRYFRIEDVKKVEGLPGVAQQLGVIQSREKPRMALTRVLC